MVKEISTMLGLPAEPGTSTLKKTAKTYLRDDIENYDEVVAILRRTRPAGFLDD